MKVSSFISVLAWTSAVMLAWFVTVGKVQYSMLSLGAWIFFIVLGAGAGLMSLTTVTRRD